MRKRSGGRPAVDEKRKLAIIDAYVSSDASLSMNSLAQRFELSGPTIKKILVSAKLYRAKKKSQRASLKKELQVEKGTRITMSDVARAAGVSVSTASRALSGKSTVSAETRKSVTKAAERMGYRFHPHISSAMAAIRAGDVREVDEVIAYLYGTFSSALTWREAFEQPYGPRRKFQAAKAAAHRNGYKLEAFDFPSGKSEAQHLKRVLTARGVRGLILDIPANAMEEGAYFDFSKFNTVTFREQWLFKSDTVGHNFYLNMLILFSELWKLGYRRIGFVSSDASSVSMLYRRDAAFHLCQYHLVPDELRIPILHFDRLNKHLVSHCVSGTKLPDKMRVNEAAWLWEQDWSVLENSIVGETDIEQKCSDAILERWMDLFRPEVVIWEHMDAVDRVKKLGLRVPEDIGIAHPKLNDEVAGWTGMSQADEVIGRVAAENVIRQIQLGAPEIPENPMVQRVAGKWVEGKTTRKIDMPILPILDSDSTVRWLNRVELNQVT